ncbi:hypothetical protein HYW82_03970 [Candidatus Peregrinibacteria bacterium]|nr:hypothetical protein [Candidatus Peregrinibacteria bacterium]
MKLKDFRKKMRKGIFSTTEAHLVTFPANPAMTNLQLHQWKKNSDIIALKRGLFMFSDYSVSGHESEIARSLYSPCYFSLQQVLSLHGIISEATFSYTLVTTKATRHFRTPVGHFYYHKIKKEAFTGFDSKMLIAEKEKALVDYFYLYGKDFEVTDSFWEDSRLEVGAAKVNFQKVFRYAKLFNSRKLETLLHNFYSYAKSHQAHS